MLINWNKKYRETQILSVITNHVTIFTYKILSFLELNLKSFDVQGTA